MTADNAASITTAPFTGTPSAYVRHVGLQLLWRWWWAWAIPVAACFIAACFEAVWAFVGFMLLFLLYPGLVLLVYYRYAFSPEAVNSLQPRTVTITDKSLTVTYTGERRIAPRTYTAKDIKGVETGRGHVVFDFRRPPHHHISIPLDAVPEGQLKPFLALCEKFMPDLA